MQSCQCNEIFVQKMLVQFNIVSWSCVDFEKFKNLQSDLSLAKKKARRCIVTKNRALPFNLLLNGKISLEESLPSK